MHGPSIRTSLGICSDGEIVGRVPDRLRRTGGSTINCVQIQGKSGEMVAQYKIHIHREIRRGRPLMCGGSVTRHCWWNINQDTRAGVAGGRLDPWAQPRQDRGEQGTWGRDSSLCSGYNILDCIRRRAGSVIEYV